MVANFGRIRDDVRRRVQVIPAFLTLCMLITTAPHTICDARAADVEISADGGTTTTASSSAVIEPNHEVPPFIDTTKYMPDIENTKDVLGCCTSPSKGVLEPAVIGAMPQFSTDDTNTVIAEAKAAWNGGSGIWPQMSLADRITAIEKVLKGLQEKRSEIVHLLMWEIGKNLKDAQSEFDRTIQFAEQVIQVLKTDSDYNTKWQGIGSSVKAFVRRAAIGIIMCLGPYNYPLNETYATLIPALLMGNIIVLKIPTVGGLVHFLTIEAFEKYLPKGTIHFVSGSGRATMPPLMASGIIDGLAFIGGSNAADKLAKQHPNPHRLKLFLQLEANNMAIYLENLFEKKKAKELDTALEQTVMGTLSYNGQRCTALKLLMVPKKYGDLFAQKLVTKVEQMTVGLPWIVEPKPSQITPLPTPQRIQYMKELIEDATSKGAKIMNENGGTVIGGGDDESINNSTLMVPVILYPVTSDMKVYGEEQFGPVIPITTYENMENDVIKVAQHGDYGQQVSIFGTDQDSKMISTLVDRFATIVGKININSQCGRSPDTLPFTGRRSSALGTMSVQDAIKEFSIPTVVAYKDSQPLPTEAEKKKGLSKSASENAKIIHSIESTSKFLEAL